MKNKTILLVSGITLLCLAIATGAAPHAAIQKNTVVQVTGDSTLYQSGQLHISRLSGHVYQHVSYMQTNSFGKVDCNGMVVINQQQAVVFDTPVNDTSAAELIKYLQKNGIHIIAVVATHFHEDCVGGVGAFSKYKIPAYASNQTIALLKKNGNAAYLLFTPFNDSLTLEAGHQKVYARFLGEGHTSDNIIGYYPAGKALFGGCLIKASGAGKGFLGDANTGAWPVTVQKLKQYYPDAQIVIPGHGTAGGPALLDYTIHLFEK